MNENQTSNPSPAPWVARAAYYRHYPPDNSQGGFLFPTGGYWEVTILDATGRFCNVAYGRTRQEAEANAARIVAAVNFCASLCTDWLQEHTAKECFSTSALQRISQQETEIDELRAQLRAAQTEVEGVRKKAEALERLIGYTADLSMKLPEHDHQKINPPNC